MNESETTYLILVKHEMCHLYFVWEERAIFTYYKLSFNKYKCNAEPTFYSFLDGLLSDSIYG